jgi:SAM-dependent methyltransferase
MSRMTGRHASSRIGTMSTFDAIASDFERFRALPLGVPAAVREALWGLPGLGKEARLLDLGAGTGRVGFAFVERQDRYVGVDSSRGMLDQFAAKARDAGVPAPWLVQADGRKLPFASGSFDAVLIVQVLSGVAGWRRLIGEARRVVRADGAVVMGRSVGPSDGLDARLRAALATMMSEAGIEGGRRGAALDEAVADLAARARGQVQVVAARWESRRTPNDFLARHRTGARFATLPPAVREELLSSLAKWATSTFGSLETMAVEPYCFELTAFRY